MQKGKNPTREQKRILTADKKDAREWFYIKDTRTGDASIFRHRTTGETITLPKA